MERGYVNLKRERGFVQEQAQILEEITVKMGEYVKDAKQIRNGDQRKLDEISL
jgi:hypothetical protein